MAVVVTDDVAESEELENLKSDIVALTRTLVQTAQETAMSSVTSTDSIYKQATLFSDRINQMRKILLPIAGIWYHAICAIFQSQPQTDATQEIRYVMGACADIVELVIFSDIQQGKHQERITTQSKLQAAQVNAKLLTGMATSVPPGSDHLEASSILWALSIQVLLNSIDKLLGVSVEGGTSPLRCHRSSLQKRLSLMSENSVRIQEASRLSSLICKNTSTVRNMRDLQQEVRSFTEAYLQAAENLNTAPLANLQQLATTELLKRTLQVKVKVLSAHLSKVNKEYMDAFQHLVHLAVLATAGNGCIENREAAQLEFDKCAQSLIGDMKAVSQKVQDCLNYVRDPRVRAVLRFTNEHLLCQMSGIVSRARKMVDSQNTCDLPDLEIHMQCWSANAHFLVVELNKVEGIHPGMKQQVRLGLQGKQPWDMPAEISSAPVQERCPLTTLAAPSSMDSATNILEQKIQNPPEAKQPKKEGKEAFVSTAKDVISSCQRVTQFIGFVTEHCLDQQCTDELLRITECIYTTTKQLTIISSVNAVTPGCRSSDEILVKNAQNLLHIILQGIRAAEAACIKGLKQPEPNSEGTEAVALCFQWRQNLMIHRAQQNSSLETDDLGLRKICPHEAAPSLAPVIPMQEFYRQKHSSLHFQSLCFLFMTAIKKPTLHDCVVFMFFLVRYT
ncbi:uncharacterized protein LOC108925844 isoform X3 [Scleropages formosus]|uniref:uncharacterized protein LOC108925844 isoform X3 n=1 Tax=Scleropages formosus TaxID=113540 RepID=UPI0008791CED|nr:uncharacterized protein LOC108925844 isoform X3 [Scleropages formosus]